MTRTNSSIRRILLLFFIIISLLAVVVYLSYNWLVSIEANLTLKVTIPTIFGVFTTLGVVFLYNITRLFLLRKKGVKGYKLRAKITSYFILIVSISIVVFSILMFYLIFLIQSTFIEEEKKVSDTLLINYRNMFAHYKRHFEENLLSKRNKLAEFNLVLKIKEDTIIVKKNFSGYNVSNLTMKDTNISSIFYSSENGVFYSDYYPEFAFIKVGDKFFGEMIPTPLNQAIPSINENEQALSRIRKLMGLIFPVSLIAVLILSIPILLATFLVSLRAANNLAIPIEKILNGTRILARGNLNYRVKVETKDELEDLARNFNSMAESLKKAYQEIKRIERIEAWQEVAKKLAHEIKNPLTPIRLSSERLLYLYHKNPSDFDSVLEKTVSTIVTETSRIEKLLNEFSRFARLPPLKKVKKDIIPLIVETVEFFRNAYPSYDFELNFSQKEIIISFDETKIKQVLFNLIRNAIETESNIKKVVIEARLNGEAFSVYVSDFGKGIPPEIEDKIFNPYFTTKTDGNGIGLALCEINILEHNGEIGFYNREDGCTFFFKLPVNGEKV